MHSVKRLNGFSSETMHVHECINLILILNFKENILLRYSGVNMWKTECDPICCSSIRDRWHALIQIGVKGVRTPSPGIRKVYTIVIYG